MANDSAFSSPTNPHFLKPLLPSFHSHLNIPMTFFSKHIRGTTNEINAVVKLTSDASDKTWEVKINGRKLTQGWQDFATGHDLRVRDIVIFRRDGDLLFHVTSFGPSCCQILYDDDDDVIQISSALQFIPRRFSRSNGLMDRKCEIILLNEYGKPWKLFLTNHKTHGRVYIRTGWRRFCRENQKRVNDLLTFKLVQTGTKPVLQLCSSIYNRDCLRASSSRSQDRFLTLTLTSYCLSKYKLCLPATFVKANGITSARKIVLVDRYGMKRRTSLKPDNNNGTMRMGKGWREFCKANGVMAGESFKLELIKEEEETATHLLKFCNIV